VTAPLPLPLLPETGFVRLPTVLRIVPIGRSTIWKMIGEGRFPAPAKLAPRIAAWRVEDLRAFIEAGVWPPPLDHAQLDPSAGAKSDKPDRQGALTRRAQAYVPLRPQPQQQGEQPPRLWGPARDNRSRF
jgi:prophage regulatory protein